MMMMSKHWIPLMVLLAIWPLAMPRAMAAPCEPVAYREVKRWQTRDVIATYCADKAETERLLLKSTPGSAVRSVVEANQARVDACQQQMDMMERALLEQLGRSMPSCSDWSKSAAPKN
jgi:hypothetical protein